MMTGVDDSARLGACIEAGAAGIVSKRAGFDKLVDAVQRAVNDEERFATHRWDRLHDHLPAQRLTLGGTAAPPFSDGGSRVSAGPLDRIINPDDGWTTVRTDDDHVTSTLRRNQSQINDARGDKLTGPSEEGGMAEAPQIRLFVGLSGEWELSSPSWQLSQ